MQVCGQAAANQEHHSAEAHERALPAEHLLARQAVEVIGDQGRDAGHDPGHCHTQQGAADEDQVEPVQQAADAARQHVQQNRRHQQPHPADAVHQPAGDGCGQHDEQGGHGEQLPGQQRDMRGVVKHGLQGGQCRGQRGTGHDREGARQQQRPLA